VVGPVKNVDEITRHSAAGGRLVVRARSSLTHVSLGEEVALTSSVTGRRARIPTPPASCVRYHASENAPLDKPASVVSVPLGASQNDSTERGPPQRDDAHRSASRCGWNDRSNDVRDRARPPFTPHPGERVPVDMRAPVGARRSTV
jgi:hypothetical protein